MIQRSLFNIFYPPWYVGEHNIAYNQSIQGYVILRYFNPGAWLSRSKAGCQWPGEVSAKVEQKLDASWTTVVVEELSPMTPG